MHTAGVAVFAGQRLANGADRYALLMPGQDVLAVRLYRGHVLQGFGCVGALCLGRRLVVCSDQGVVGYRTGDIQPVLPDRHGPYL